MSFGKSGLEVVLLSAVSKEQPPQAVIYGLSGTELTDIEKSFFKEADPFGFILFARNCESPSQVKSLTSSLNELMGRELPILIDQEGGRVQRLGPPHWPAYPPAHHFGDLFRRNFALGREELYKSYKSLALDLYDLGITVNCAPVLDVLTSDTHDIIGDRAYSSDAEVVAALGSETCRALLDGGVLPVIKHIPGHGRATQDSHEILPVVSASEEELRKSDFIPFKEMQRRPFSEAMWAMTAHVTYTALDERAPATCSRRVIWDFIRDKLNFQGLLVSDDVSMQALKDYGGVEHRAEKVLRSGCDIALHCNGDMDEMQAIAKRMVPMTEKAVQRHNKAAAWIKRNLK